MENIKKILIALSLLAVEARANDIHLRNSKGKIPINVHKGTTIEFPRAIKAVDKSSHFQIRAITKKIDEKSRRPVDIRSIHITPNSSRSRDYIKVRLAGGRQIVLRIISQSGADLSHRIHLRPKKKTKNAVQISEFLEPKIKLLRSMIEDSQARGFERIETSSSLDSKNDNFDFDLTRKYLGKDRFGYVLEIENDTDTVQRVSAQWFSEFAGQKISIAHLEHESLVSCSNENPSQPCKTRLFLISSSPQEMLIKSDKNARMPFSLEAGR